MTKKKRKSDSRAAMAPWIEARRRYRLSSAHVQMARELGMNPKRLGKIANHDQERWKAPLPQFIEELYLRRFGRVRPERSPPVEGKAREIEAEERDRREVQPQRRPAKAEREHVDPAPGPWGSSSDEPPF